MSRVRRPRVASVTGTAVLVSILAVTGCSGPSESSPRPTGSGSAATDAPDDVADLADLDTLALVVPRAPFCDRVEPEAVARALGEDPGDAVSYRSGQRVRVSDDVADVVHEFGCRWTAGESTAEAWVFAPPVTRERAVALAEAAAGRGCTEDAAAADFGRPTSQCARQAKGGVSVSHQGLFGDAWLTCSLFVPDPADPEVAERASQWCAAVATGASSG